eukprot:gene44921-13604_t
MTRLVVMSATVEAGLFMKYFAPVAGKDPPPPYGDDTNGRGTGANDDDAFPVRDVYLGDLRRV